MYYERQYKILKFEIFELNNRIQYLKKEHYETGRLELRKSELEQRLEDLERNMRKTKEI